MRSWRDVPELKWLIPGMGVKRWVVVLMVGVTTLSLGLAYLLVTIYRQAALPRVFYYLTLQFIPRVGRALLFGGIGVGAVALAIYQLSRTLLAAFWRPGGNSSLADTVYQYRQRSRGAKVVAIGGGTGLSSLLRGVKKFTSNLTAIVTVADDGGSSGRLRRELGVLPPGDFRNCIAAMADAEALMTQLFQYRFSEGEGLTGHSFGNLFIVAMAGVTGNFERALAESSEVLAVRGRILPSTLEHVTLCAELADGDAGQQRVEGESSIPKSGLPINRVYLEPSVAHADAQAVQALLQADLIVLGPGSLYTSVLPNLLVEQIAQAIRVSRAPVVYVCNVATQPGETDSYTVEDHVRAIEDHVGPGLIDVVVANNNLQPIGKNSATQLVQPTYSLQDRIPIVLADLTDPVSPWRHDPDKLARCLLDLPVKSKGR